VATHCDYVVGLRGHVATWGSNRPAYEWIGGIVAGGGNCGRPRPVESTYI
jgi:hypothetical protein